MGQLHSMQTVTRMRQVIRKITLLTLFVASYTMTSCGQEADKLAPDDGNRLIVVATTSIVGDVASEIGGDLIALTVLLPPESDPHSYEPVPQDLSVLESAQLVLKNGLGFEAALDPFLDNNANGTVVRSVSDGIYPIRAQGGGSGQSTTESDDSTEGSEGDFDPHVWFDPTNVVIWTRNIENALSLLDPENGAIYAENANAYRQKLRELDNWIANEVARIPVERRLLVTDHDTLGYFARRYDFVVIGMIIPATSTLAEPSAQGMVQLADEIKERAAPAVFVGPQVNSSLAEQIAAETGISVIVLRTASLGIPVDRASNYLDFMRSNTKSIVSALSVDEE
jgi:zinc/manganese transport system substrate-binding protein